jgi:hypothetical protein
MLSGLARVGWAGSLPLAAAGTSVFARGADGPGELLATCDLAIE